jgi:hypothetical protein
MYFAPGGECEIVSPNSGITWRIAGGAAVKGPSATTKVYPFMTAITVGVEREKITAFQVTIDAPHDEGIRMLYEDSGGGSPFNVKNLIRVRVGYADMNLWTPWYQGMLQQGGDGIEITPEGVGGTLSAQQHTWCDAYTSINQRSWAPTPLELMQKIAESMGRTLDITPGAMQVLLAAPGIYGRRAWGMFAKDNTAAFGAVCRFLGLTWGIFEDDAMTFGSGMKNTIVVAARAEASRGEVMGGRERNAFVMRGQFNPQQRQFPILKFGPDEGMATWLGSTVSPDNSGASFAGVDKRTGKTVTGVVAPLESADAIYGASSAKGPAQDTTSADGAKLDKATVPNESTPVQYVAPVPDGSVPEVSARAQAVTNVTQGAQAQMATLTSLGIPDQFPFDVIDVYGLSPRYDGPYEVIGITHRWSAGSYESDLKIQRHGAFQTDEATKAQTSGGQIPAGA